MIRKAFTMHLYDGMAEEYEKRHNELWPEMKDMIHQYGGHNYSIHLDPATGTLFGYIELEDEALWAKSADLDDMDAAACTEAAAALIEKHSRQGHG